VLVLALAEIRLDRRIQVVAVDPREHGIASADVVGLDVGDRARRGAITRAAGRHAGKIGRLRRGSRRPGVVVARALGDLEVDGYAVRDAAVGARDLRLERVRGPGSLRTAAGPDLERQRLTGRRRSRARARREDGRRRDGRRQDERAKHLRTRRPTRCR
jgi:hypothetical protein